MRRRGFSLAELLLALGLAAVPLLVAVHLIQSNVRDARFNRERATARLVLIDTMEILLGERCADLRTLAGPGSENRLEKLLQTRIARLPGGVQAQYRAQAQPFLKTMRCVYQENVDGQQGLCGFVLSTRLPNGAAVEIRRLFRPAARPGSDG